MGCSKSDRMMKCYLIVVGQWWDDQQSSYILLMIMGYENTLRIGIVLFILVSVCIYIYMYVCVCMNMYVYSYVYILANELMIMGKPRQFSAIDANKKGHLNMWGKYHWSTFLETRSYPSGVDYNVMVLGWLTVCFRWEIHHLVNLYLVAHPTC